MNSQYQYETHPLPHPGNVIAGERYRITVLTERLLRLEYSAAGRFEDRASQTVWFRDLGTVDFTARREADGRLTVETGALVLRYDGGPFSPSGLSAKLKNAPRECDPEWFFGRGAGKNLGGTARTLDEADGAVPLDNGVLAEDGFAVLDDSHTLVLTDDGWVAARAGSETDLYLFAYAHDYKGALRDFYRITGPQPLLPRYALGNWWSRYYEYTQESYRALMERFDNEGVPFSVAVLDMDWHLVNLDPKYGDGWTGYTWNRELFPDPPAFLSYLHGRGMAVTLNVHPAGGVRAHEEAYPAMAKALGTDPASETAIPFDITNRDFLRAYFEFLHHPLEKQGVDFWWIDWQQGAHTRIPGLDPLWMLNHFHYLDSARGGRRPMTFSRYAGPGSHRYPVGFSGDSIISWASLSFQPYFTYTASNIGYGWWSHDIGGHMLGEKNDAMQTRWVQLGVFSPVNRLHSSKCAFSGKEPWNYGPEARAAVDDFLRLRHRLLPYLYTMNRRAYAEGLPIVTPVYYEYPEEPNAYPTQHFIGGGHREQYFFGSEMIVYPIVSGQLPAVRQGKTNGWIPDGLWHDFFTGLIYRGGRCLELYRPLSSIPVLVKAGGIVPMTEEIFGAAALQLPQTLTVRMYGGADGDFTLYEDDGVSEAYRGGHYAQTRFALRWQAGEIVLHAAEGDVALLPERRTYTVELRGTAENEATAWVVGNAAERTTAWSADGAAIDAERTTEQETAQAAGHGSNAAAMAKGAAQEAETSGSDAADALPLHPISISTRYEPLTGTLSIELPPLSPKTEVRIRFARPLSLNGNHERERLYELLNRAQIANAPKENAYAAFLRAKNPAAALSAMQAAGLEREVYGAAAEILTAALG